MTAVLAARVALRRTVDADRDFLRELFLDARPDLRLLPDDLRAGLVDLQVRAQVRQYSTDHPGAVDHVVETSTPSGVEPVGRCWIDVSVSSTHLLDLAVHSTARRQGVARAALSLLTDRPVTLNVWSGNQAALALYASCGFEVSGTSGDHLTMRRDAR
ncbi:GNAT family N-acetyltransferase [Nocardioides hwasunensis]|uniref:N-acetyltransferase n=1 Tax=Nocardioides hwasunensis TaxID=397258 RepID=A0ABR8MJ85_9ACTN|nr:GNAT family N-acetyltransferase [Nocardioides hwasunensis]MBD3915331.1 N-acetyltransferase [Nocardioides hwasunensis]